MRRTIARWTARVVRSARRDAQLPAFALAVATGLRAGLSLAGALDAAAGVVGPPLADELAGPLRRARTGAPLTEALDAWRTAPTASDDVRLLATALRLGADAGGNLARSVDRVAATLRERHALRGEARALATQARTSALVLGLAPIAFAVLVAGIDPRTAGVLLGTPAGWACLVVGLGLEALGAAWMRRITRSVA